MSSPALGAYYIQPRRRARFGGPVSSPVGLDCTRVQTVMGVNLSAQHRLSESILSGYSDQLYLMMPAILIRPLSLILHCEIYSVPKNL